MIDERPGNVGGGIGGWSSARFAFRALLFAAAVAAPAAGPSRAADLPGAEVLERGQGALAVDFGFDLPQSVGYSVGYHYAPLDRIQIGGEITTFILANALSATSRVALVESPEKRFRLSFQGAVRGVFVAKNDDDDSDDEGIDLSFSWDTVELLVLEPRIAVEVRPFIEGRWRFFDEFGSQHYYGTADGKRLLNGGNLGDRNWGTAFRASGGFAVDFRRGWALDAQGGVWGSFREPLPVLQVGFTKRFGGDR